MTSVQQAIVDRAPRLKQEAAEEVLKLINKYEEELNQINEVDVSKRIGIAKGKFKAPDDFDACNEEVYAMLREFAETPL